MDTNRQELINLISELEERDPEHGEADVVLIFADQYAPDGWETDDEFNIYDYARSMPVEYMGVIREYMEEL